jgi:hypothetical protein
MESIINATSGQCALRANKALTAAFSGRMTFIRDEKWVSDIRVSRTDKFNVP